ncbi:thioesterase family protein [Modestobacter sp. I12A-02628]|uniref:Thioesterase family protein n=1 Tax=Goekera deserti TaxID=2497753 RepID=A0A7K3WLN0_9ACTN|nr:thioesterase family protein [Goekera deserti]MPQ99316.1 thioesterase family protein [Goekera deserti]NDI50315.1 thioesterase family protein [Goekera deserti]NEL56433.1 thioesterase family protein [Goekera deserti]
MLQTHDQDSGFARSTAVRRDHEGRLTAQLDGGWEVGGGILNGGYLLAVAARAAVLSSPHPHAVALAASYLRAGAAGPAHLQVTPGPTGRTLAHSTVVLADEAGPVISVQATTGTLDPGPQTYTDDDTAPPSVTPVEDCIDVAAAAAGGSTVPGVVAPGLLAELDCRLDPATAGWAVGAPAGEAVMRAWVRLADGRDPDPLSLVALLDCLPPSIWGAGTLGWAPTVQLQALVRALPAPGWCLVESRTGQVAGGWIDEDYRVWDATGRLVAVSRQLARTPRP